MGRWENGKMGRWDDGKMGRWEDGKIGHILNTADNSINN